ncbi:MAG TPA: DUF2254 family protein [Polyangia bacterium]|jgi:hypothetical protein|nr:DUF2254 family protein [Polyangia bacterium]
MASGPSPRFKPLLTLGLLTGFALCVFAAFWLLDFFVLDAAHAGSKGPLGQLLDYDVETMQNALGSLAQVIAAVLGIAITVVSIVVQLAANRYTSRVTDMFFRDRTNLGVMGFFVVACIEALWVSFGVGKAFVPRGTITVALVMATASLLLLVPYFAYVFDFLDPEKVIARIGAQTLESAAPHKPVAAAGVESRQTLAVSGLEQLAGIAMNALGQKEKTIATDAAAALRTVLVDYLPEKQGLPGAWFGLSRPLRAHPDFVAMAPESLDELAADRTWLEWIGLRQIREVFGEALKTLPEMTHVIAIDTRYIGEAALDARDRQVLTLTIKFMNTYLRTALNARDVRTSYNVLHQYRQLAEAMLRVPGGAVPWITTALEDVAGHFKYYAQLAHGQGLGFVTETAAYDLCALCELASELGAPSHDRLLAIFLEIDKEAETTAEERALRGVRKAQVKLATFYLQRGLATYARAIYEDMAQESPERLRSIRDELLSVTSKQFWEVVDRGTNFDYIDDARKEKLAEFFAQFESLTKLAPRTKGTGPYRLTGP